MEENKTLRGALEVSQRQLAEAEGELREIRERVRNLRAVVFGLKQLLDPGDSFASPEPDPNELSHSSGSVRPEGEAGQQREPGRRDEVAGGSVSIERAVQLLAEAGRPMRMEEIRDEWERRGWVNPRWKAPKSAINMVYQRAFKAGLVGRMPDRSWVLPLVVQDRLTDAAPDEGDGD
ncbi:hypothetical protein JGS39_30580 [Streptomyces sp. P01-B04]|uniref:hypothetical protein n=1 Tax=Streptomyces poriferorum TaxID=2798799 RepID=UPI001C5D13EC|nr:hypothetical protein [Streptomyces poriferorum]MBW5253268.1 hypothetical protein [Streptomyces poriferorum]MBW5260786.1 hypothetical protein [Streptomyces poriferorum]